MFNLEKLISKINYHKLSLLLYLFGCVLVFYFIFFDHPMENYIYSDMLQYKKRSLALLNGNYSPMNLFHPTGMVYFSAIDARFFSISNFKFTKTVFFLMTILIPLMAGFSFQKIFNKKIMFPIAAMVIFHYHLISFSGFLLAEIPSSFFITLLLFLGSLYGNSITKLRPFSIGAVFVFSFAFKGNIAFFLPAFIFVSLLCYYKKYKKIISPSVFKTLGSFLLGVIVFLTILAGLNKKFLGYFQAFGSVGGINFYMAKCPNKVMKDRGNRTFVSPVHHQLKYKGKVKLDAQSYDSKFYYKKALECLIDDPKRVFLVFEDLSRMFDGTYVWPAVMTKKYSQLVHWIQNFYALIIFPGLLIFFFIFFRQQKFENIVLTSLILGSLILPFVFVGDVRYRSVFDPIFIPAAFLGWIAIAKSDLFKLKEEKIIALSLIVYLIFCIIPVSYTVIFS